MKTMKIFGLLVFLAYTAGLYSQADRPYIRKGNASYENDRFQEAEIEYRKALEKDSLSYRADFNLGNSLYKQKQYDAAAVKYGALTGNEANRQKLNRYFYNLGNAYFENRKYRESAEAYKNALRNDPGDMDAKHNLQLALKMLDAEQQKQDNNQQNKDQQQKQDQQQKDQKQKDQPNRDRQQQNQPKEDPGNQESKQSDPQQPQQEPKGQISPEDAERILQALENEEKNVMKKVQEQKQHRQNIALEKNW